MKAVNFVNKTTRAAALVKNHGKAVICGVENRKRPFPLPLHAVVVIGLSG